MRVHQRLSNEITNILAIIGLIVMFFILLPASLGGRATYLVVNGKSMEPKFHLGDLAVVKPSESYQIGDIVAYKNQQLENELVIHRIVNIQGDYFVLKGDNNTWLDTYKPTSDEIIGKLWLHLPYIGNITNLIKKPISIALLIVLGGGIVMIKPSKKIYDKRKKTTKSPAKCVNWVEGIIIIASISGAIFLVLAAFAFTRPLQKENKSKITYTQKGVFSYSAATTSDIYDNNELKAGDPIFPDLTCEVKMSFSYQLSGIDPSNINGYQSMDIIIADPSTGWKRTIVSTPKKIVNQTEFSTDSIVDVCKIEEIVEDYLTTTKLKSDNFSLSLYASVILTGDVEGQPFSETFSPNLDIDFDQTHFYLRIKQPDVDPTITSTDGSIEKTYVKPNQLSLFGINLPITELRNISIKGLTYSLGLLFVGAIIYLVISMCCKEASIALRYCPLLVEIDNPDDAFDQNEKIINVNSIEDLGKIADRDHLIIMHGKDNSNPPSDLYYVESEKCLYRFISINTPKSIIHMKGVKKERLESDPGEKTISPDEIEKVEENISEHFEVEEEINPGKKTRKTRSKEK